MPNSADLPSKHHTRPKPFFIGPDEITTIRLELGTYLYDESLFSNNDRAAYSKYEYEYLHSINKATSANRANSSSREVFCDDRGLTAYDLGYRDWLDPAISEDSLRLLIADFVEDIDGISSPKQFSAQLFWCYTRVRRRLYRRLGLLPVPQVGADMIDASLINVTDRLEPPDFNQMQRRLSHQKQALPATPAMRLEDKAKRQPWPLRLLGKY